jgi:hypothetical protein
MRVPAILFGALIVPIGLLYVPDLSYVERLVTIPFRRWYGWSAEAKTHWIMPIIGTTIFGFGAMMTLYALSRKLKRGFQRLFFSLPIHLYLVDTFTYAASALSAASVRLSPCLSSDATCVE